MDASAFDRRDLDEPGGMQDALPAEIRPEISSYAFELGLAMATYSTHLHVIARAERGQFYVTPNMAFLGFVEGLPSPAVK